jgi:hypothetical protein
MDCIHLIQYSPVAGSPLGSINAREFVNQLSDYCLLKDDSILFYSME